MTTELQALLDRALNALHEDDGREVVANGRPVLRGAASRVQNALHLAQEIELAAETGWFVEVDTSNQITRQGWDPREEVPDAIIWRADRHVALSSGLVTAWEAWWPRGTPQLTATGSPNNPPTTTSPTFEEDMLGRGAREWPGLMVELPANQAVDTFMMRNGARVSEDLQMGTGGVQTITFWVCPDMQWLADTSEDMPIICKWGGNNCAQFWLGITGQG